MKLAIRSGINLYELFLFLDHPDSNLSSSVEVSNFEPIPVFIKKKRKKKKYLFILY